MWPLAIIAGIACNVVAWLETTAPRRVALVRLPRESTAVHGQNATVAVSRANPQARQATPGRFGRMPWIGPRRRQVPGRRLAPGCQAGRTRWGSLGGLPLRAAHDPGQ